MAGTDSISKGCFVFKGKKNAPKIDQYFFKSGDNTYTQARADLFKEAWSEATTLIQKVQYNINQELSQDLLSFIKVSTSRLSQDKDTSSDCARLEIPTAALLTGVNTGDRDSMFTSLVEIIKEEVTPHVAILQSRGCTNLKTMLQETVSQLSGVTIDEDDESALHCHNMADLTAWYRNCFKSDVHVKKCPKKRRSKDKSRSMSPNPPLLVILEDLEGFSPKVLEDFIMICSNHIERLPLVLVLGIATNVSTIHRLLQFNALSRLAIEKFSAPPASRHLSQLIHEIFLNPEFHCKLGPRVFQLLLDIFLFHEFSVYNFISRIKFSIMNHFSSQPLTFLMRSGDSVLKNLSHCNVETIRRLPSFMKYVEQEVKENQVKLLLDDNYTKTVIRNLLEQLDNFHRLYYPTLICLHSLVAELPQSPLGKLVRELYGVSLKSDICESRGYSEALALLSCLSRDEFIGCLNKSKDILLNQSHNYQTEELIDLLSQSVDQLVQLDTSTGEYSMPEQEQHINIPKRTNLHNLRKSLKEIKKNRLQNPYELLRSEIIERLNGFFREKLPCPCRQTLHELFYYDNVAVIKTHFYSAPRASLQTALSHPHHYLQCMCCQTDDDCIAPTLPDVCIAYKLHLECGRLINLYDWLQAFVSVVTEDKNVESESDLDLLQARFIRAISELQFLGFIKSTKRKTDHVSRLTWGGC